MGRVELICKISVMSFTTRNEGRHPTSYTELQGVEIKISEKLLPPDASFLLQAELGGMTLRDLHTLDKYQYDFAVEHSVLQNFSVDNMQRNSPH